MKPTTGTAPQAERPVVFLHIGSPKSGTTFLQQVLWFNKDVLRGQGVLMPGASFAEHELAAKDLRDVAKESTDPVHEWTGVWDRVVDRIFAVRPPIAIISHETLCAADAEQVARAVKSLAGTEVHVVYTARDLAGLIPSEWQEYVKHRCTQDYAAWLEDVIDGGPGQGSGDWFWKVHDIADVLARWAVHIPTDRIHVVTVPPPGAPRDLLWRRFAELVGIDPDSCDLDVLRPNTSLGVVEAELLRRVNLGVDPSTPMWLYTETVTDELGHRILPIRENARKVPFPDDRHEWVRGRAERLVKGLADGGYDVVGDLSELLLPAEPRPADHSPVTDEELFGAAVETILGLLDRVQSLRDELRETREGIAEERAKPLPKVIVRHMSDRNRTVLRARVAYWHLMERITGQVAAPERLEEKETVWSRSPKVDPVKAKLYEKAQAAEAAADAAQSAEGLPKDTR